MLVMAAYMPSMVWRVFTSYLRMKKRARIAGKEFYQTLVLNGVPSHQARALANEYESAISLRSMLQQSSRAPRKKNGGSKGHMPGP
jgi:hypothetical protein